MTEKGKYFVLEGLPKCGKSTQARMLYEALISRFPGQQVILTREPGGSEIANAIRTLVQGTEFGEEMTPECEAYLYAASRAQTLRTVVRPVVERGGIVVSDRSVISSVAFQGGGRGLGAGEVMMINQIATRGITPDKTILIDTDPVVCNDRAKDLLDGSDKFERMSLEFFRKVRQSYLDWSSNMEIIPGEGTIDHVHGLILNAVLNLLISSSK